MSWFDFLRKPAVEPAAPAQLLEIPLFPLAAVLFPDGLLSLKVFEQRYLEMAAACMKAQAPFGVCLMARAKASGVPAMPHQFGTLAHIASADMQQLGILLLEVRGGQRFRVLTQTTEASGLLRARVELLAETQATPVPQAYRDMLPLLQQIVADLGCDKIPEPHRFDDAAWVGYRLTEALPVQALAKQKLLELNDAVSRLEILHAYLSQRGLVKTG